MKIGFCTPDHKFIEDVFGCATYGFPDTQVNADLARYFSKDIAGIAFSGLYAECLKGARSVNEHIKAAIVFTENRGGENQFINELFDIIKCPIVGGGVAIVPQADDKGLFSKSKQASVFLITDTSVLIETEFLNIHDNIVGKCHLALSDSRTIQTIDGVDGIDYLRAQKERFNIAPDDFERFTLSTNESINTHLREEDGVLKAGCDLLPEMLMRYVNAHDVQKQIQEFYDDENAIIFGCAGLRGILDSGFACASLGAFLFGEICYTGNTSVFGNLMLSKLKISPFSNAQA